MYFAHVPSKTGSSLLKDALQVPSAASVEEIKGAFKRRALQVHPDKGGSKESRPKLFAEKTFFKKKKNGCHLEKKMFPECFEKHKIAD